MICPNCQSAIDEGMRFCGECGTPLPAPVPAKVFCPECGAPNEQGDLFCAECGYRMDGTADVPETPVVEETPVPVVEEIPAPVAAEKPVVEEIPVSVAEEVPVVEETPVAEAPAKVFCPECGAPNEQGDVFCAACGHWMRAPAEPETPVVEETPAPAPVQMFCSECGTPCEQGAAFCPECGTSFAAPAEKKPDKKAEKAAKKAAKQAQKLAQEGIQKAKKLPKWLLIVIIGVLAVAITVGLLAIFGVFGGGSSKELSYATYLKDGEIYYTEFGRDDTKPVTDRLVSDSYMEETIASQSYIIGAYSVMTDNGRMFYPDRLSDDMEGMTIYYRNPGKKKDAEKLDSGITQYVVNEKGNRVIYLKGTDGKLYLSNLKEKEKLASDVRNFTVNEDMSKILYQDFDGDVYLMNLKGEKEKLVSEISSLEHVSDDLQTLYYIKDGDLYLQEVGKDRVKIDSDVDNVVHVWETGEVYYTTGREEKVDLWKFVDDDMALNDAAITEPVYPTYPDWPDYPYWWEYDTDEEYEAAVEEYELAEDAYYEECDRLNEEYDKAYELYWDKMDRDWLREEINGYEETEEVYDLYFFDGKESNLVVENMMNSWPTDYTVNVPVVIYDVYGDASDVKVKLSEMENVWDVTEAVYDARYNNRSTILVSGMDVIPVELEEKVDSLRIRNDGKQIVLATDVKEETGEGNLYTMDVKSSALGEAVQVDEDVYAGSFYYLADGRMCYFKNVKAGDENGDLFIDGKEIDSDVSIYNVTYNKTLDALLYYTDYESGEGGTLKILTGKEPEKVSDDVNAYRVSPAGDLFFLYDFSDRDRTGELYLYGNKNERIDEDVSALLSPAGKPGQVVGYASFW